LDWIFEYPIFNSSDFADRAGIPDRTARRLLTTLREHRILQVFRAGNGRRGTILVFPQLLNVAEGRDVF
jgi:DNA-binding IclR family transcriptional regulator